MLRRALDADDTATKPGVLQRLDARVKVVTFGALLLATAMLHQLALIVALYLATTVLAAASRVPVRSFVARVWCFVPIFSAIIVIPALFNVVTPGDVVVSVGTWFGVRLGVTLQGVVAASTIVARVATSIALVGLLTLTTSWTRLLRSLRALFVPSAFVMVLGLTYRYLLTLLACVHDMYLARKARAGRERDVSRGRQFVASSAASLFGKALAMSEEVHQAMVARGYSGRAVAGDRVRPRLADVLLGSAGCAVAVLLLGVDRAVVH
jgi:cobalt/nickel transport system permease protein